MLLFFGETAAASQKAGQTPGRIYMFACENPKFSPPPPYPPDVGKSQTSENSYNCS